MKTVQDKTFSEWFIHLYAYPGQGFYWGKFVPVLIASIMSLPVALIWFDLTTYFMWIVLFVVIQLLAQPLGVCRI